MMQIETENGIQHVTPGFVLKNRDRLVDAENSYQIGLINRRWFRNFLNEQIFLQDVLKIEFHESKGFLGSEFIVKLFGPLILVDGWGSATEDMIDDINERRK